MVVDPVVLESMCRGIAASLGDTRPAGIGFAIMLFDLGEVGNLAYVSNGQREDMAKALRELLNYIERG